MKINVKDEEKITKELANVQKLAKTRTVEYKDILTAVEKVEERLSQLLFKKDWVGLSVWCDPNSQEFAASYNGIPQSTQFILRRFPSGWFVTKICRIYCGKSYKHYHISGFEKKAAELVDFASMPF